MKTLLLILLTLSIASSAYAGFYDDKPEDQSNYINSYDSDSESAQHSSNFINQ